jgi:hypothetical protein
MTTAARTFRSSPYRDTVKTWEVIVDLLTKNGNKVTRAELLSVTGVAAAILAEKSAKDAAIVATGDGPRTRIYCVYDDDALDDSEAKEDALGFEALAGDWAISLPCPKDDLAWVQAALKQKSTRITARDLSDGLGSSQSSSSSATDDLGFNAEAFLKQ